MLDSVSKDWIGLVEGNYESVIPIFPTKTFWGRKKGESIPFLPYQSLYSSRVLSPVRKEAFAEKIKSVYGAWSLTLDTKIKGLVGKKGVQKQEKSLLDLSLEYAELRASYDPTYQKMLEDVDYSNFQPMGNISPEKMVEFYMDNTTGTKPEDASRLHRIIYNAMHRGIGYGMGITDEANTILAINFVIQSHNRLFEIMPATSSKGKAVGADFFLLDQIMRRNAKRRMLFELHPNKSLVPDFYSSFQKSPFFTFTS